MSNSFTVEVRKDYLEFYASGEESYDFSLQCFNKVSIECHKKHILKALVVDNLKGQLSIDEVANLCEELTTTLKHIKLAYVDLRIEDHDISEYAGILLRGEGLDVHIFQETGAAIEWITNSKKGRKNGH